MDETTEFIIAVATLIVSCAALLMAIISLVVAYQSKDLYKEANLIASIAATSNDQNNVEKTIDDCVGSIKYFIYDCQNDLAGGDRNISTLKDADRNLFCGFTRLYAYSSFINSKFLEIIAGYNCKDVKQNKKLFARCFSLLTSKYMNEVEKEKHVRKEKLHKYLNYFENLYNLLYENIKYLNDYDLNKINAFTSNVEKYYLEIEKEL